MRLERDKRQCWCCVWYGGVSGPVSVRGPGPSGPTVSGAAAAAGRPETWRRCQTARPSPPPRPRPMLGALPAIVTGVRLPTTAAA